MRSPLDAAGPTSPDSRPPRRGSDRSTPDARRAGGTDALGPAKLDETIADGTAAGIPTAFRWALDASADPSRAAADWLAREIVPNARDAAAAVASTQTSIEQVTALKTAFKALRTGAATPAERNRAARLYAAAIATGLVRFGTRISRQSDGALRKAFAALRDDPTCEEPLRDLATVALSRIPRA